MELVFRYTLEKVRSSFICFHKSDFNVPGFPESKWELKYYLTLTHISILYSQQG